MQESSHNPTQTNVANTKTDEQLHGHRFVEMSGLRFERHFSNPQTHPFDEVNWIKRDARILDEEGNVVFEQNDVEAPESWSQLAMDIVASKYFRKAGVPGTGHETSVKQVLHRIVHTLRTAGEERGGYFASAADADTFEDELTYLMLNQMGAFNSPVWFNCGLWHDYGITGSGGNWTWSVDQEQPRLATNAYENPQCSACFILGVDDSLDSMLEAQRAEVTIFKHGSGSGWNASRIRGSGESLTGGGSSSGVMSFLKAYDSWAGSIKSGGTTRRAAKMVILNMDHPDIVDFIEWKQKEEKKALALIREGYSADFNGEAYHTVSGQNSNNSVRIPDAFMNAYLESGKWKTHHCISGEVANEYDASELMDKIADAAWTCADPGVQFDDTIQQWHTCKNTDRINATNPCSEYVFLDDSACNLASINLVKFLRDDGSFDVEAYRQAVRVFITAMDIAVDFASYPTEKICRNSHDYRPLGLGYANLGTMLMLLGIPYDSEEGRAWAGALTGILCGHAYRTSAEIAASIGPFSGFKKNEKPMLDVIRMHRDAGHQLDQQACPPDLSKATQEDWEEALRLGIEHGYRNSQATVIAPTGTIGLALGCDTTGIEPDFALVKFKKLAGGGYFKIVNESVPKALARQGYTHQQIQNIVNHTVGTGTLRECPRINTDTLKQKGLNNDEISKVEALLPSAFDLHMAFAPSVLGEECLTRLGFTKQQTSESSFDFLHALGYTTDDITAANDHICGLGTIEGAPHVKESHYPIFDCANKCGKTGQRFIAPMGHVKMIAATQPFISGSISKTVNIPTEATVAEIKDIYVESWKLGIKCMALYRDGSKGSQPLSTTRGQDISDETVAKHRPIRKRLPDERPSLTHKFSVAGHEGYIHVGLYPDTGNPGEIFIVMAKQGSTLSGIMDAFATAVSISLQYGVPLSILVNKFSHTRFEPTGITNNEHIRFAKSIIDYIFRWLALKFLSEEDQQKVGVTNAGNGLGENGARSGIPSPIKLTSPPTEPTMGEHPPTKFDVQGDAPACDTCGSLMTRAGVCYRCMNCGATSGCG